MGKTFVAMAVAVSILLERSDQGPIVVMSPPSLREKWPKDWKVFTQKCIPETLRHRFRAERAESGVDFLRLLDDSVERRSHVIFLSHGALHRSIGDGFVKLAVIKRAFKGRSSLNAQRQSFSRFAGKLLWLDWVERRAEGLLGTLLDRPYESWLKVMHRADARLKEKITDDPVPQHLAQVLESMSGQELEDVVLGLRELPLRESTNLEERLRAARQGIAGAMENVWKVALRRADFRSPLLILDEAHHVKNPGTRLASLFATEESVKDSEFFKTAGPLGSKFERMLFLTATPFQLGHSELVRVLERFEGIAWDGPHAPELRVEEFKAELKQLGEVLDDAQAAALRLDRAWGRLGPEHLATSEGVTLEPDEWWQRAKTEIGEGIVAQVAEQVRRTKEVMEVAEQALSPWVLRYLKPSHLPDALDIARRVVLTGASIREGGSSSSGLEIAGPVLLPFLLAGRAQALLAASSKGRALFAEGLASSFEAYLETRNGRDARDEDADSDGAEISPEIEWYLKHLDRALPKESQNVRSAHPKIRATAERAMALWRAGEKVLIFCHYRATGRALRQHVSALIHEEIMRLGGAKLPGRSAADVQQVLDDLGKQFFDNDELRSLVTEWLNGIVRQFAALSDEHANKVVDVVRRFIRTPSFLVRYFPLESYDIAQAFVSVVDQADGGQYSLRHSIEHFCRFLSERCIEPERVSFLEALEKIQTGTHFGKEVRSVFDPAEASSFNDDANTILLPNVRLANGEVSSETRLRLLLAFNTPLFPEILIASSVLAEGVDLHLNCRYVIHHDLCWNPSTLEQRSGRVDRIGSKAERVKKPIHLFMPYVAATQDEKMFRVVRDRERWFQIVMGEKYDVDEASTDRQAARILLPREIQQQLSMRLHP
ncbi:MAG TPA: helicase-related protein [Terriglobia bacterium]|nr:helicase-related protein [Terriglobia bacterium]